MEGGSADGRHKELIPVHVLNDFLSHLLGRCLPLNLSGSATITGLEVEEKVESHGVVCFV